MKILTRVARTIQQVLGSIAEQTALALPLIKRRRKFSRSSLAQMMVLGFLEKPHPSSADLARMASHCGCDVTPQAIEQRMTADLAGFLEALFLQAVQQRLAVATALAPMLERFKAVNLLDSTTVCLPDELAERFAGCGGSYDAGRAAVKFQVRLDLRSGAINLWRLEPGRQTDQGSTAQSEDLVAGSLQITDQGYFHIKTLVAIEEAQAFWLSRLPMSTEICWPDGRVVEQIADLFEGTERVVDRRLLLGKTAQHPCRVVVWRMPQEVADRRRQKLIATARQKGNPLPTPARLRWCDWGIYLTNVPAEKLSVAEIGVLYRARWQIELLFKRWKSQGGIAELKGTTLTRQLIGFWSSLLAVLMHQWLLQATGWGDRCCSAQKVWKVVAAEADHLARALGSLGRLIREIRRLESLVKKHARLDPRRKHPGTFQLLNNPDLLGYNA